MIKSWVNFTKDKKEKNNIDINGQYRCVIADRFSIPITTVTTKMEMHRQSV